MAPFQDDAATKLVNSMKAIVQTVKKQMTTAPHGQLASCVVTEPLRKQVQKLPSITGLNPRNYGEIDRIGTDLWNACRLTLCSRANDKREHVVLSRVSAFAFFLIDFGTPKTASGHVRVLRAAFTAARFSIENAELELALSIMAVAAQRLEGLKASTPPIDLEIFQSFVAENFTYRMQLEYLKGRPEFAEHLFSKVPKTYSINNGELVVQVLYNIGCHAIASSQNGVAIKWLERAVTRVDECNEHSKHERSGIEHLELLVRHSLVRSYLSMETSETKEKMKAQLKVLKEKYGGNPAVIFLQLEILRPKDEEETADAMGYLKYGGDLNEDHALQTFQLLLKHVPLIRTDWVERSFIALVSQALSTSLPEETKIEVICDTAQILNSRGFEMMSEPATHAVLAFIWKHISTGFETNSSVAQKWCLTALNTKLFEACSSANRIQIQKKFVNFSLDGFDTPSAREMLQLIHLHNIVDSEGEFKNDFQVLFLMWRLALQECKDDNPKDCICQQILQKSPPLGHAQRLQFIQVCTLEAQRGKNSTEVMKCLHEFTEEVAREENENRQLPLDRMLQREDILFLIHVLSIEVDNGNLAASVVTSLAHHIANAIYQILHEPKNDYTPMEQEWVLQKCYALICILLENSKLDMIESLMHTLRELIIFLQPEETDQPRTGETMVVDEIGSRYLLLVLILNVCRARSTKLDEVAKSCHYEKVRIGLLELRNSRIFPELDGSLESLLWGLCFEACIHGKEWNMALWAFHNSSQCDRGKLSAQYLETILSKEMPSKYKIWLVREILRQNYGKDDIDSLLLTPTRANIPHHLHVLFHLCITAQNHEDTIPWELEFYDDDCLYNVWGKDGEVQMTYYQIAESILDLVNAGACDQEYLLSPEHLQMHYNKDPETGEMSQSPCEHSPYPTEELAKLASLAFNQAMDFYADGRDGFCKSWAKKSIHMASMMGDDAGDELVALFEERLKGLF
ncbi:Meiosis specific protein SPO22 [Penicillium longicatenatum]|uniref:Meiosis specific protein SPO22 n=1 Tax=Penicillium longicatenatum TaxID=1561947 RepID=UPI00254983E6|nr:Meiosis specific protein SPO22 [Penicillium longicatenatum]KAJ5651376.1 Meiosis specific protein SPO22 [Penicillium longicatenatum]